MSALHFFLQNRYLIVEDNARSLGRCSNRVDTGRCTSNTVRPCTLVTAGKNSTPFTLNLKQRSARVQNNMSVWYYFVDGYQVPVAPFNLMVTTILWEYSVLSSLSHHNVIFCNLLFQQKSIFFYSTPFYK